LKKILLNFKNASNKKYFTNISRLREGTVVGFDKRGQTARIPDRVAAKRLEYVTYSIHHTSPDLRICEISRTRFRAYGLRGETTAKKKDRTEAKG